MIIKAIIEALEKDGEKLRAVTGIDHGPFQIPDDAFESAELYVSIRDQLTEQIMKKLVEGIPVTLTMGDRKICTYYPSGVVEHHDY